jgi:hypothetical protein
MVNDTYRQFFLIDKDNQRPFKYLNYFFKLKLFVKPYCFSVFVAGKKSPRRLNDTKVSQRKYPIGWNNPNLNSFSAGQFICCHIKGITFELRMLVYFQHHSNHKQVYAF